MTKDDFVCVCVCVGRDGAGYLSESVQSTDRNYRTSCGRNQQHSRRCTQTHTERERIHISCLMDFRVVASINANCVPSILCFMCLVRWFSFLKTNHMRSLMDFVEAQACYFDQCNQHAQELQKQLARSVYMMHNR